MLVIILTTSVIVLGVVVYYMYFIAPKLNPANRAEILLQQNRIEEAIVELQKVLDSSPYDINTHKKLADLYMSQNKEELSAKHLERLVEINRFNNDIVKGDIYRTLARMYLKKGQVDKSFEKFYELIKEYPSDSESLYHVGFIALGQEHFETAYKYLEQLSRQEKNNYEILFGAGISALQSQRSAEAINLFKSALAVEKDSEITTIALSFAFYRKRDYKNAMSSIKHVADNSTDENAMFIAKRLLGFIYIEAGKNPLAVKQFDEIREFCVEHNWEDELRFTLYDLGFASLLDDKMEQAYEHWNKLYQLDRNFRNIQDLITRLRKEMDSKGSKYEEQKPVVSESSVWKDRAFPENFVWNICGLKSENRVDIGTIIATGRNPVIREKKEHEETDSSIKDINFDSLYKLDSENFRSVAYRVCEKLGLVIDEILNTYRESDGVDFLAFEKDSKIKTLVWVRRWKGTSVGEIPLRNFAQAINDAKAKQGFFITTSPLTASAESILKNLEKVNVIYPEEMLKLLKGLV
ncbi:MAG TPA: restriction endonuclease [Spirochaetota bacterium]|nr:restriction endonuclease [Spirochaetota bacterium]HPR36510.1 restriction endonuclease [Spirochaetota bacterium]HRX47009.1 restriction endonuclease [Spirochaetota bacterium]